MVKHCPEYRTLQHIPTIFTIHNGQYQGWISWRNQHLLPYYDANAGGMLEWKSMINPMASAVKNAWAVTTVSPSYLGELHHNSLGLEPLFRQEWFKEHGILNGIDAAVWDPKNDPMIQHHLKDGNIAAFKAANKRVLCEWFGLSEEAPLISFIGRMVSEKGVDLLPDTFRKFMHAGGKASFLVLGTGEPWTQNQFRAMAHQFSGRFNAVIDYNEALAHQIYAGSDFLIMPSRVEPCGLNQMYAMRYGAIPIVRAVGGLKDTVPDIGEPDGSGRGIRFDQFSLEDAFHAVYRAVSMWHNDPGTVERLREKIMAIDFSWESAVQIYFHVYRQVGARLEAGLVLEQPAPEPQPRERIDMESGAKPKIPAKQAKAEAAGKPAHKTAAPKAQKAAVSDAKPVKSPKKKSK
jgi:starch synthase